jgi:hypothetical protein
MLWEGRLLDVPYHCTFEARFLLETNREKTKTDAKLMNRTNYELESATAFGCIKEILKLGLYNEK